MSDPRQQLIDAIDALTPDEQQRALELLRALSSGEAGADAASGRGDGATNQPPETESRDENRGEAEPSQEEIDRRTAALERLIGSVDAEPFANDIDEELYGSEKSSEWVKQAIQRVDELADTEGHEPVESDEIDDIIYGL